MRELVDTPFGDNPETFSDTVAATQIQPLISSLPEPTTIISASSNPSDSAHTPICFEGPEKRLEIDFKPVFQNPRGFRVYTAKQLQKFILDSAKCTIISQTSNQHFDSYVLSESSLFVYPYKVILKTCGTTTLLAALPNLLQLATQIGSSVEFVTYSRKNFNFPQVQPNPHSCFQEEVRYLNMFFEGTPFIFGPMTSDHWFLYVADYSQNDLFARTEYTLEIMMSDLDPACMKQFYKQEGVDVKQTTKRSGISDIIPETRIDDCQFEPCGYSMNGLLNEVYSTIHITPEPQCSYVSYETNLSTKSFTQVIGKVLETFRPGRFSIALFVENSQPEDLGNLPWNFAIPGFKLAHKQEVVFGEDITYSIFYCNYKSL